MKTWSFSANRSKMQSLRLIAAGIAATLSAQLAPVRAAEPSTEDQTHTLFMGLDLSIEHQKSFHRVRDVSGDSFVITAGAAPVLLPVNRASHNLKVSSALKLTGVSGSITNLKSERTYTAGNDPQMNRMKEMNRAIGALEDNKSLAIDRYASIKREIAGPYADPSGAMERAADEAMASFESASILSNSALISGFDGKAQSDLAKELYDAIEVKFELSAETPLNNPYILLVARFREPNAPPSTARNWIYAESLRPIDSTPVKFHRIKGGFPPGYILEDFKVHLYNRGEEVATNVSSKRVPLTREEAFEYVKIQYIASHKGATVPATPAMGKLPPDFNARITGGQFNRTYYVKVSKDGVAEGAFMDADCKQKIEDEYLESVVNSIRFKPALEKGKPVSAVAQLKLDKLPL